MRLPVKPVYRERAWARWGAYRELARDNLRWMRAEQSTALRAQYLDAARGWARIARQLFGNLVAMRENSDA